VGVQDPAPAVPVEAASPDGQEAGE
jgi:hypothetical protein